MAKGADGILCLLTDKIDAEVLDAAGMPLGKESLIGSEKSVMVYPLQAHGKMIND